MHEGLRRFSLSACTEVALGGIGKVLQTLESRSERLEHIVNAALRHASGTSVLDSVEDHQATALKDDALCVTANNADTSKRLSEEYQTQLDELFN